MQASTSVSSNWICTEPDIIEELVLARVAADAIAAAGMASVRQCCLATAMICMYHFAGPDIHAGIMDVSDVITLSTVDALVQSTAHRVGHRGKPPRPAAASAQQSAAASASQPRSATGE